MLYRVVPKPGPMQNDAAAAVNQVATGAAAALAPGGRGADRSFPPARSSGMIEGSAFKPGNLPIEAAIRCRPQRIVDISSGPLQVRLAEGKADIDAAQALRYRIFYESLGARAEVETARRRRDFDRFDEDCDHLLVLDHSRGSGPEAVVGTYRLIRREAAIRLGGFYSAAEYDIARFLAYRGEILELGRSCVDAAYRQRPAMQLLWSGIAAYVFHYGISLMFGCASLPGTDPDTLAVPLSYLHRYHLAPPALRARALPRRYVEMSRLPDCAFDSVRALAGLPPLIKGYLRLGGFVGDGAVIDQEFNTTDVCIVVKTDLVSEKYSRHYVRRSKDVKDTLVKDIWAS
jgi:L-ornithine Nalpha-acyltransferase